MEDDIPEVHAALPKGCVGQVFEEPVGVGGSSPCDESGLFVLSEGAFGRELTRERSDAGCSGDLLVVPVSGGDVHNRGKATSVFLGDGALVEFESAHNFGIDGREEAEEVCGVEDGHVVQEKEVLVGGSTADVVADGSFPDGGDARQGEEGAEDIGFAEHGGYLSDGADAEFLDTHLHAPDVGFLPGDDDGRLEAADFLLHADVDAAVAEHVYLDARFFHAHAADLQDMPSLGYGHREESKGVG